MRRIFLATLLALMMTAQAWAATVYVDGRILALVEAQVSGSDTTHIKMASPPALYGPALTTSDLLYGEVRVFSGTSAPAVTSGFKISAVDVSDPNHPILTVATLPATPAANWEIFVYYGANANTGASPVSGSGTTGPKSSIQAGMSAGTSGANTIYVRGQSIEPAAYTEVFNGSGSYVMYGTAVGHDNKTFVVEGYLNTPGDGCQVSGAPQSLSSTFNGTSDYPLWHPKYGKLKRAAGHDLDESNFPVLRGADSTRSIYVHTSPAGTPSITFRYFVIDSAAGMACQSTTANTTSSVTFDRCAIGTSGQSSSQLFSDGSTSGIAKTFTFTKCKFYQKYVGVRVSTASTVSVNDCYFYIAPADGNSNYAVWFEGYPGSTTLGWDATSATWLPDRGVLYANIDSNEIYVAGAAAYQATPVIFAQDEIYAKHYKVTRNKSYLTSQSWSISLGGVCGYDLSDNLCEVDNATGAGGFAQLGGADATTYTYGEASDKRVLRRNAGTVASTTTITLDGSAGSSTTNDVYRYRLLNVIRKSDGLFYRGLITGFNGMTKVATCSPASSYTASDAVVYWITEDIISQKIIRNNYFKFLQDVSGNRHNLLIGQGLGTNGVVVEGNTFIGGDNGLVIKGENGVYVNNRSYGGAGACLIKGGCNNYIHNNTFYVGRNAVGGGAFTPNDKSDTAVVIESQDRSKTIGNDVQNNIFIVASGLNIPLLDDSAAGAGDWATEKNLYPALQANRIDYNIYYTASAYTPQFTLNGSNYNTFALYQAAWPTASTWYGAVNESHSVYGSITLADPVNGDFRVTGGTAANTLGCDGQFVGAARNRIRLLPR